MTPADRAGASPADYLVAEAARQIREGDVVATGVASPLALLAVAAARRVHAPHATYLNCNGAIDPVVARLGVSSEDPAYVSEAGGRIPLAEIWDHARRGRIDVMFFGAAQVDPRGHLNLTAIGDAARPRVKLAGPAGSPSLAHWTRRAIVLVAAHSPRVFVPRVDFVTAEAAADRRVRIISNLAVLSCGPGGPVLESAHPHTSVQAVVRATGFPLALPNADATTLAPEPALLAAIAALDPGRVRDRLVA